MAAAIVAFLLLGSYTRRASVAGQLVPLQGVVTLPAPVTGIVERLDAAEGDAASAEQTLAIIQALLVKVQEEMYAIPLGSIDSTINIHPDDIKTVQNQEVIVLRGQIIPIINLSTALQVPRTTDEDNDDIFVVVVYVGERKAGIVVDNLIGQQEIVIKTLGKLLSGLKIFSGATVLGDGRVALILDVSTVVQQ